MKRGPSKGYASAQPTGNLGYALTRPSYIKELAERLNALEGQIHPGHGQQTNAELQFLQHSLAEAAAAGGAAAAASAAAAAAAAGGGGVAGASASRSDAPLMQTPDHNGRKRTHSQSDSYGGSSAHQTPRLPPYGNTYADTTRPSPYPASHSHAPTAPMQPPPPTPPSQQASLQPFFKYGGDTGRRESVSTPYDPESANNTAGGALIDWDDEVVDE